jgi:hypothetical protein
MALLTRGSTKCSLCGVVIQKDHEIAVIGEFRCDPKHPIARYLDSCVHRSCFENWEYREEFTKMYANRFAWMAADRPAP